MRRLWAASRRLSACDTISPGAEPRGIPADSVVAAAAPEAVDPSGRHLYARLSRYRPNRRQWSNEPMSGFDKREEGFEKKFALDEELRFKAMARRNKYFGLWAAEKLGLSSADA